MALRALMLRKKINEAKKNLEELTGQREALRNREAELERAIEETENEEQRTAVEEEITAFEADRTANDEAVAAVEETIRSLESELEEEEAQQEDEAPAAEAPTAVENHDERSTVRVMNRKNFFARMTEQERTALFSQDHVKSWLNEIRSAIRERRALQNVGLTIPEEFIGFLRENIENYSKLMKYVNVKKLGGDGRIVIMGGVPEAIWTECCANINELELQFNDDEFGCWKIAGFYPVCNANLEDSDLDLANEILTALSQGLGLGVDKAIVYGTGIRMPQGIVTRLVQTSKPAGYSTTAREWVDLHTSNVKVINSASMTPAELFKEIVLASGAAKSNYARNGLVWVMNETTKTRLMADTISVDANGKIVTGVADTMPVLGGAIETLNFMPDYVIVGGYFECYTLAERAGKKFATSEHVRFLADQTVFKGTARYDGHPVIAEAFVVLSLLNTAISADAVSFDPDVANTGQGIILEKTVMTVKATKTAKVNAITVPAGQPLTFTSSDTSKATVAADGTVTGVAAGNATIIVASGNAVAAVALTVTAA